MFNKWSLLSCWQLLATLRTFLVGRETSEKKKGMLSLPGGKREEEDDSLRLEEGVQVVKEHKNQVHYVSIFRYCLEEEEGKESLLTTTTGNIPSSNPLEELQFQTLDGLNDQDTAYVVSQVDKVLNC